MKKNKILLILLLIIPVFGAYVPVSSMGIRSEIEEVFDEHRISFSVDFTEGQLEIEMIEVGDREYSQIHLMDYEINAEPGKPMLPVVLQSVGIPLGAQYSLKVSGEDPQEIALSAPLLPKPTRFLKKAVCWWCRPQIRLNIHSSICRMLMYMMAIMYSRTSWDWFQMMASCVRNES